MPKRKIGNRELEVRKASELARRNGRNGKGPSVLVIGSSNTDMMIKVDRLPQSGETILGGEFTTSAGGKGANQAVAASRAGAEVTLIARVGQDVFGEMAIEGFRASRINTEFIVRDGQSPSGVALIYVGKHGQNSIAVASGANSRLSPGDVQRAREKFSTADVLLVQLETPLKSVRVATGLADATGLRVILNPAPAQPLPRALLTGLYLLTPNEIEAELLTGITVDNEASAAKAADSLLRRGIKNVIVTMGAKGAFIAGEHLREYVPAYKVGAVDATGAGDVFNGALAVAIAEGKPLFEAALFANAAAAISVTRLGAQSSAPTRKEIEHLMATGRVPKVSPKHTGNGKSSNGWSGLGAGFAKKPTFHFDKS